MNQTRFTALILNEVREYRTRWRNNSYTQSVRKAAPIMLELTLDTYFDTHPNSSSSYFDFVEKKVIKDCPSSKTDATEPENSGKDAFVVQVMDEETSQQLKLQYFNGTEFPE